MHYRAGPARASWRTATCICSWCRPTAARRASSPAATGTSAPGSTGSPAASGSTGRRTGRPSCSTACTDPTADTRYRESPPLRGGRGERRDPRSSRPRPGVVDEPGRLARRPHRSPSPATTRPHATLRADDLYVMGLDGSGHAEALRRPRPRSARASAGRPTAAGSTSRPRTRGASNVWFAAAPAATPRPVTDRRPHAVAQPRSTRDRSTPSAIAQRCRSSRPTSCASTCAAGGRSPSSPSVNADVLAGMRLGQVEEIWYTSSGGARVQGWIVKPPDFDPRQKYPLILEIHGGPHAMYSVGVQLHVPELRRQRLRGALHQPARQHRLRHGVRQRASTTPTRAWTTTT